MTKSERRAYCRVISTIPAEWRAQFTGFVETGEASPAFLAWLEATPSASHAVDAVLRANKLLRAVAKHAKRIEDQFRWN